MKENIMDEICTALSNKIYSCTREGYGIFYEDELMELLPDGERTRETLEAALKKLVKGGYLDVKYAKGSAFCMAGVKLYEPPPEELTAPVPAACTPVADRRAYLVAFAVSFLGGALGSFLCGLIFYVI